LLHANISDEVIAERKKRKQINGGFVPRGYVHLYQQHVEQAHLGADFDFLRGISGSEVTKDSH
jgi:dihydroxy-acid dehydratase